MFAYYSYSNFSSVKNCSTWQGHAKQHGGFGFYFWVAVNSFWFSCCPFMPLCLLFSCSLILQSFSSISITSFHSILLFILAQQPPCSDRSPASKVRVFLPGGPPPPSLMPAPVWGPYGSTRQITPALSHCFCWQNCSPPQYFALRRFTPHPRASFKSPPLRRLRLWTR